ncbi:oxidized low-density lipoprotein receptor 1-like [Tachysurus fulvidraco]|uniref:oxidized low-density lipoprotein receptor 1-like n=1 Tax=Tachysurus fulvidraco TaxID=1234273 RepID=UPI001FEF17F0|nr:oxidized low-density lipoprotein receptor 1-like [Tachysurus fulvidraco]
MGGKKFGRRTDDYVNAQNWQPRHKACSDISDRTELKDKKKPGKIFRSAFGLLILGVLLTLCAVGILYHNKVISHEILSKQYSNVTETLRMQEHETKEIKKLFEALKVEHQQVQEELAACSANKNNGQCEEGWKSLGLKSYYFSSFKLNWTQSRDYCVEKGGHLVIITSQEQV